MKSLIQLTMLLLLLQLRSVGQLNVYGPVADNLQTSTYNTFGVPTSNYWWCAHGIDVLLDGYLRTRQDIYKTRMKNLLLGIKSFNGNTYINTFYDDMEWLGIASLRSYQTTGDADYLAVANQLWTDIQTGYSNGALDWNKNCPNCKNTCANTPAVIMGVRLYRMTGVAADLQRCKDIYAFVKAHLVDATTGAVWDNYNPSTGALGAAVFSYNVGTYIGAGLELYKVTGDVTYLNDAVKSAEYVMTSRITNGMFFLGATGMGDGGLFNGIFVRYFALLAREGNIPADTRARYNEAIRFNAEKLRTSGISSSNLVGPNWTVPPTTTDYATQLSGVMLMEAAATLDQSFFYKDINYGGAYWGLAAGSYNTAALVAKGIKDNDITAYTIPAGYQVTFYKNDNFSGGSMVVTGNSSWIGGAWNDSISSLIVAPVGATGTLIQAENYSSMSGIITETTTDTDGGQNVGAIDTGDWMAYNSIYFPTTGTYKVEYRVSSLSGGGRLSIDLNAGTTILGYLDIPSTGAWQSFTTISHNVTVTAGTYNLGVYAQSGGWNINWLRITPVASGARVAVAPAKTTTTLTLYPNPVHDVLRIKAPFDLADAKIQIVDMAGKVVMLTRSSAGSIDVSHLPSGVYNLVIMHNGQQFVKRFVK
ncbi:carbohydrate-binding protein [Chitinophaga oryziterrae]|uniref:Carbohydrate-binding protein n=1 Tax=Chitinophaga oryziterrae TaxID=1031224 RepID=A0A6N8J1A3_9BACT|nr:glycoside hydrolase family 76 protein [Chitinophaga oryziterrae]MVT38985.1 carbohydrate-binding protein [Chitinophaga oryziterrae]